MVIAMLLCACIAMIQAEPAFAKDAGEGYAKAGHSDAAFNFRKGAARDELLAQEDSYPAAFDLRNVNGKTYVTPVRLQNPYGTCWGFAAIAAAESSLIASGLADETVDLSEKHLAYFTNTALDNPDSPQNGEGTIWPNVTKEQQKTSAYKYDTGGVTYFATSMFASGIGPNLENRTDPSTGQSLQNILAYRGARGEVTTRRAAVHYDAEGNPTEYARVPVWNSDDDDWAIPEKYRFYQSFELKDSFNLPSIHGRTGMDGKYSYSPEGMLAIKQQMYEKHRAVCVSFCAESYVPGQDTTGKQYMSKYWAHYTNEMEMSNHAVTIVGWDDNYPKENFLHTPEGDGAFLIKNSWGSELNEFPNNGYRHWGLLQGQDGVPYDPNAKAVSDRATGYFWISYYDRSLGDAAAFEFDKATSRNGYYVEQMDYMQASYAAMNADEPDVRMANVFTAEGTGKLTGISVMTTTPGSAVSYEVRLLPDDYAGPEDGLLIASGSETFQYGGYHRITLAPAQQKVLARGQKYSVAVTESVDGKNYVCYTVGSTDPKSYFQSRAIINPGESYCYAKGQWNDLSDRKIQKAIMEDSRDTDVMDNFPIKSYLEKVTYRDGSQEQAFDGYLTINNWQDGNTGTYEATAGESKILTAEFRGLSKSMPAGWDPQTTWTSGDPSVMTVTPKEDDCGQAVIQGIAPGSAYLTVDAGEYGMRILRVKVRKLELLWTGGVKGEKTYKYTGKAIEPKLTYVEAENNDKHPQGYELIEGVDYRLTYKDNVNVGEAKVIAVGIGDYTGTADTEFTIRGKAVALKVKGKSVKVNAAKLAKKTQTIKASKAYKVTKAGGKLTYQKDAVSDANAEEYFSVNKKSGNIKVKKGLSAGTYLLTVRVNAAGHGKTSGRTKYVKVNIRVQ